MKKRVAQFGLSQKMHFKSVSKKTPCVPGRGKIGEPIPFFLDRLSFPIELEKRSPSSTLSN